jgi:hypothetical protein
VLVVTTLDSTVAAVNMTESRLTARGDDRSGDAPSDTDGALPVDADVDVVVIGVAPDRESLRVSFDSVCESECVV